MSAYHNLTPTQETAGAHWLARLVVHLFRCRHHDWTGLMNYWTPTAINSFGMPSEERCENCGEYRHRVLDHRIAGQEEWKTGRHPKSK
jgi:hypothetical protein